MTNGLGKKKTTVVCTALCIPSISSASTEYIREDGKCWWLAEGGDIYSIISSRCGADNHLTSYIDWLWTVAD